MSNLLAPFFGFRTALESFSSFVQWGTIAPSLSYDEQILELRSRLQTIVGRPEIREAILLASPDLDGAIPKWFQNPSSPKGQRIERALVRYISRLCGRSTPFGLFAGTSMGAINQRTKIELMPTSSYRRRSRLDMGYLLSLVRELEQNPAIRSNLLFKPNPGIYYLSDRLRYPEADFSGIFPIYKLVSVEKSDHLIHVLTVAKDGLSMNDIAKSLITDEINFNEAIEFVIELVNSQLLVSNLALPLTGSEPVQYLLEKCRSIPAAAETVAVLNSALKSLSVHDELPLDTSIDYNLLTKNLKRLIKDPNLRSKSILQVDLIKPVQVAFLDEGIHAKVHEGVELLRKLFGRNSPVDFSSFCENYQRRYDSQEMPLFQVLDPETGIGYKTNSAAGSVDENLLAGIAFPPPHEVTPSAWYPINDFLLEKVQYSLSNGMCPIQLTLQELEPYFLENPLPLPDAYSMIVRIAETGIDQFQVVFSGAPWGPSGACLLGRFCHGDPDLTQAVKNYLYEEEKLRPNAIFAEIIHLPNDRSGNVIIRPVLRRFEIPFLGPSGVDLDHQIPINDLLVSIKDEGVVLRSSKLKRQVIPRLTSAQNFDFGSLAIYRFLCELQYQGICIPAWEWGALSSTPFLPRIQFGNVVLSTAHWNIKGESLAPVRLLNGKDRIKAFTSWAASLHLPRFVIFVNGDQKLPLDIENILCIEMFLNLAPIKTLFRIEELYPGPTEQLTKGPEGPFIHELIIPFLAPSIETPKSKSDILTETRLQLDASVHSFMPGSVYLYSKLYTGKSDADTLLRDMIAPFIKTAMEQDFIQKWWFIRYGDPDWHLRLRIQGDPKILSGTLIPELHRRALPYLENQLLWKMQFDTYTPEFGRYGSGIEMELAERIFQADSQTTLALLEAYQGNTVSNIRWKLALLGVDSLLNDFGFGLQEKLTLMTKLQKSNAQSVNLTQGWESQLGYQFRKVRSDIIDIFDRTRFDSLAAGKAILSIRSRILAPIVHDLQSLPTDVWEYRTESHLHMSINRLFRSAHRAQEAVLYFYLYRYYQIQTAKSLSDQWQQL